MKKIICVLGVEIALFLCGLATAQQSAPVTGLGVTRLVIAKRQIAFGGASFGSAGPYEILTGTAYGEIDPRAPSNVSIVNASRAPLNAKGHVEYSVDVMILKPVDVKRGNSRLLYDFVNRGRNTALAHLNESGDTFGANDSGNGFLMNRGYTVAWSGWQADAPNTPPLLKANVPIAMENGKPVKGMSREEFTDVPAGPVFSQTLTYPALLDTTGTTLTVREREADPRKPLPATSWHFIDERHIEIAAASG